MTNLLRISNESGFVRIVHLAIGRSGIFGLPLGIGALDQRRQAHTDSAQAPGSAPPGEEDAP